MPANRSVLASGSADGTVMMWDVRATAKGPSYTLRSHTDRVTGLLASGGSVYSCSEVRFLFSSRLALFCSRYRSVEIVE